MPRKVDGPARRKAIAEAVWRLIIREGLEATSVRRVAKEASLSMGSLRHYFRSQDDLLSYSMRLVHSRARSRIEHLVPPDANPIARGVAVLSELLPLDRHRLAEAHVWTALSARSLAAPGLADIRDQADAGIRALCARVVDDLMGATTATHLLEHETERLYALIDGLALHGLMRPQETTPTVMEDVLATHLTALAGSRDGMSTRDERP